MTYASGLDGSMFGGSVDESGGAPGAVESFGAGAGADSIWALEVCGQNAPNRQRTATAVPETMTARDLVFIMSLDNSNSCLIQQ